jgi:predicted AAA+ superfamily ATPase
VGAHLLNSSMGGNLEVTYWRDRNQEVDFVLRQGDNVVALEVKSGRGKDSLPGMEAFARQHKPKRQLLVGGQGIPIEEFLARPADHWMQ